jgi:hypothetical protein
MARLSHGDRKEITMQQSDSSLVTLLTIAHSNARLMAETGLAISAIGKLIDENNTRADDESGREFLTGYTMYGLAAALELLSSNLQESGAQYLHRIGEKP